MNRNQWTATGIVIGLLLGGATLAVAQGLALSPGTYDLEEGQYVFNVPALQATPIPVTDTPVAPTDTPVPPNPN